MLDSIKRWLGPARPPRRDWQAQADWAQAKGWPLRGVRDADGFVIDGRCGTHAWRLEWGPSQRSYIAGDELRLRAELELPRELQVLLLDRRSMEAIEHTVFEQYVEGVQTRIDTGTPAEMRWLVMYPKLGGSELKALRERYGALASFKPWLLQWLEGPLTGALDALVRPDEQPLVLMVARRRLSLRTALAEPEVDALQRWLALFECALREAQRVSVDFADAGAPSTQPSLFPQAALRGGRSSH